MQSIVVEGLYAVGCRVMFHPFVLQHPAAFAQNPCGQRPHIVETAAAYVDETTELLLLSQFLLCGSHSIVEGHWRRRSDECALHQHQIVHAVGALLQQITGIVAHVLRVELLVEPCSHEGMSVHYYHDGEQSNSLEA